MRRPLVLLTLLATLLGGCQSLLPPRGDRLVLGSTGRLRTLDPADAYESLAATLFQNLGDRLYTYAPGTTRIVPQLATALPQVSADGLTYRIPLRRDVRFHDGSRFDAAAMAFSLRRFQRNGGQASVLLADRIAAIATPDPYTLEIRLTRPFAPFLSLLTFPGLCAVSPRVYRLGAGAFETERFVGTGPYRLVSRGSDRLRLEPFPDYWGGRPANGGIDLQLFTSGATLYNALGTGLVDVTLGGLDVDQVRALQQQARQGRVRVVAGQGLAVSFLSVNLTSTPLDQRPVRQALAAALDRPLLDQRVFAGQVEPLYSLVPPAFPSAVPAFERYGAAGDPALARRLLTGLGYSVRRPLRLTLWYRSNTSSGELVASTLRAAVQRRLGGLMQLEIQGVESTTAYQNLDKGAYPLFLLDWAPDFFDPDNYLQPFLACQRGNDREGCQDGASRQMGSFYWQPTVQRWLEQSGAIAAPGPRQQLLTRIQRQVAEDVPYLPLWVNREYLFTRPDVRGRGLQVTGLISFGEFSRAHVAR